ncbi:MAG TPA: hypothetical protein VNX68_09155, partial [Nitrosopumilaceae archaeon]|nr:hypothetical protein [Nitrosopumilaceae archaeon]
MQDLILKYCDFLTDENWIYGKVPVRLNYLRNLPDESGDANSSPYERIKALNNYMQLVLSDCYRSPISSAKAYCEKQGVQKPGYSAHNVGAAVDLAINKMLKIHDISYIQLVENCVAFGVTPYAGISATNEYFRGKEDWHMNIIGDCANHFYLHPNETVKKGGAQAIEFINRHIKFDTDQESIDRMLEQLKFSNLQTFKNSL